MADPDLSYFRDQLLDRRGRIATAQAAGAQSPDLARLMRDVDNALERIGLGTFGICETCHDSIEKERLLADPLIRFCLDHLRPAERRELEEDLALAARVQSRLLPARRFSTGGWEACYHFEPCGLVGGDYCDLHPMAGDSGRLFFATGDVSGKGVSASLLMSHLHATFRTLLSLDLPLAELLGRANRLLAESTLASQYATLACGLAWPSGEIEICNAGHCPALLLRDGTIESFEATGLPLGLFSDGQYSSCRLRLDPGDSLVLYTDGLTEARNALDAEYGADRLAEVLHRGRAHAADALAGACVEDLTRFLAGAPKRDDLTVMVIRRS